MHSLWKRYLSVGPGGIKCNCCFPRRGKRKAEFRKAKRRANREAFRCEAANAH